MTNEQLNALSALREKYQENYLSFSDWQPELNCSFNVYEANDESAHNIVVVMTLIDKIDESLAGVMTYTENVLITEKGTILYLSSASDPQKIDNYIKTLRKIQ